MIRKGVYWHIFPTKTEAKDAIWRDPKMLFDIIPEKFIRKKNEVELVIYYVNGSIHQLKGADDPDALRGSGPCGVILDEFAKMKYETWGVIEPILRENNGWAWFVGTPKGKNHLYNLYLRGLESHYEWYSSLLKADQSGLIEKEQLRQSRLTMSESLYNQEWQCEFLEGEGSVFRNVQSVMTADVERPKPNHMYVMGVDLAKVQDYTVVVVYDRENNNQVYQDRWRTLEWPFQKKRLKSIHEMYNKSLIVLDATGLGDPIADDLMRERIPVVPYKISNPSKKELIEKLSIWIDQKRINMLNLQETLNEFETFNYKLGENGRVTYGADEGFNDDIVIAHALAVSSLQPLSPIIIDQPKTIVQQMYEKQKEELYRERFEDQAPEWSEWSEFQ